MTNTEHEQQYKQAAAGNIAEEISNAVTHAIGSYLGAAAIALLVMFAVLSDTQVVWKVVSAAIFGGSIVLLYSASAVYHAVTHARTKLYLRDCDQMAIYALIAGTYTPFCLVTLRQSYPFLAWAVLIGVWGIAAIGIFSKLSPAGSLKCMSSLPYLAMGWFSVFLLSPLYTALPMAGIIWILLGGVFYTLGVLFYVWRSLPFSHTIWHLFVLGGTISHFFGILFYVMM